MKERPFTISIMGQTGVGKSSLLNVLFDKNIPVDDVQPTTRRVETYHINGENECVLIVHDFPGIGESFVIDQGHLEEYKKFLHDSDLVLWAIQADSRSTTFDVQAFEQLLEELDAQEKEQLMSKMTIVLTKVDTIVPSPWFMFYNSPTTVKFEPGVETRGIIQRKQEFFQRQLIEPFGAHIISRTHNDLGFSLDEAPFSYEGNNVVYRGLLTKQRVKELSVAHPRYRLIFERLYDNYCPIPCSARFKYNLPQLMLVIFSKLGLEATQSFKRIANQNSLRTMSLSEAKRLCNLLIWHEGGGYKIFDLEEGIFPDVKRDTIFYRTQARRSFWPFPRSKNK